MIDPLQQLQLLHKALILQRNEAKVAWQGDPPSEVGQLGDTLTTTGLCPPLGGGGFPGKCKAEEITCSAVLR